MEKQDDGRVLQAFGSHAKWITGLQTDKKWTRNFPFLRQKQVEDLA